MEEIISNTRGMENRQKNMSTDWFDTFEQCYGITESETDRLKPLNDIQDDKYLQQGQSVCSVFCNKVKKKWYKRFLERRDSYRQLRREGLENEGDAYEIIGSCRYALNKVYDIHTPKAVRVNLRYKCGKGKVWVETADAKASLAQKSPLKKVVGQFEPHMAVSVLYGSPRILLMAEFLKKCFEREIELRANKGKADRGEDNSVGQEKTEAGENREENDEYGEESRKDCLTGWLVSNCLYTLGELVYAEQYIAECRESYSGDIFDELCNKLGIPWAVMGRPVQDILHQLKDS